MQSMYFDRNPDSPDEWEQKAEAYRGMAGQPTAPCSGCPTTHVGPAWARAVQARVHWYSCPGVSSLSFHPDGSLASVTFRR